MQATQADLALYLSSRTDELRQLATWLALGAGANPEEVHREVEACEQHFRSVAETATTKKEIMVTMGHHFQLWCSFVRDWHRSL